MLKTLPHGVPKGLQIICKKDPKDDVLSKKYLSQPLPVSGHNLMRNSNYVFTDPRSMAELYERGCYGQQSEATCSLYSILGRQICKPGDTITTLTPFELLYLTEKEKLDFDFHMSTFIQVLVPKAAGYKKEHYLVYKYLRERNWFVKPGHNYGGVFAVYLGHPDYYHSSAIIYDYGCNVNAITAAVRVTASVKKACWMFKINPNLPDNDYFKVQLYMFNQDLSTQYITPLTALPVGEIYQVM